MLYCVIDTEENEVIGTWTFSGSAYSVAEEMNENDNEFFERFIVEEVEIEQ